MITEMTKSNRWLRNPFEMIRTMTPGMAWDELPKLFTAHAWMPKLDVFEKEGELVVKADLPGVLKENVKVTLDDNFLVIQGERKEEKEVREESYFRSECEYGSFYRRLPLDFKMDPGLIKATFKDGVLEVKVPILEAKPAATEVPVS